MYLQYGNAFPARIFEAGGFAAAFSICYVERRMQSDGKVGAHFCNHGNTIRKVCLEILIATGISNFSSSLTRLPICLGTKTNPAALLGNESELLLRLLTS